MNLKEHLLSGFHSSPVNYVLWHSKLRVSYKTIYVEMYVEN